MMTMQNHSYDWNLSDLLKDFSTVSGVENIHVMDITLDSRKVLPGSLFIACRGLTVDARQYIDSAIEQGAVAVLWEPPLGTDYVMLTWQKYGQANVPVIAVERLSAKAGFIADRFFSSPSAKLSVTGITGTNGKTSCSHFIAQALSMDGSCGLSGTLGTGLLDDLKSTLHTTPDVVSIHRWLSEICSLDAANAVMEVSSHALEQGRVNGVRFDCAVFTNLSHDHLDYHGDMQSYERAKTRLFIEHQVRNAVINLDDPAGQRMVKKLADHVNCMSYGLVAENHPDVHGKILEMELDGMRMQVTTPAGNTTLHLPLLGKFNASNALAVLAVLLSKQMPLAESVDRITSIRSVAGRMQQIRMQDSPVVVVDYAHTPDALQLALTSLREHCENTLWCVFGCGGDRDRSKRPVMGSIAAQLADQVVVTNDNPRTENPETIIDEILAGIENRTRVHIEQDRAAAIRYAIEQAGNNDLVLVAGKGHEDYQQIGTQRLHFSDTETVMTILEEKQHD